MKNQILIFILIFCTFLCKAQNITNAEYFWDTDPGFGMGNAISVNPPGSTVTFSAGINTSGLEQGFHFLFIRLKDADDNWGMPISKLYYIDDTSPILISRVEYFWNTDPGYGLGNPLTLNTPSATVSINSNLSTDGLNPGFNHLFIRTRDQDGNWSIPINKLYYIDNTTKFPLTRAEYFWNTDPGFGNGQIIAFNPSDTIVEQVLTIEAPDTLSNGVHQLYIRLQDSPENWSISTIRNIFLGDSVFVDQSATGLNDGGSWINAFTDLQDALHVAPLGSIILVAEGTYTPDQGTNSRDSSFAMKPHLHIVGGFPAGGSTTANPVAHPTILSGEIGNPTDSSDNSHHVIISENIGDDLRVENMIIRDGYLNGGFKNFGGAGWYNSVSNGESSPRLINCEFKKNYSQNNGGGFSSRASSNGSVNPVFDKTKFINNEASDGGGAAMISIFNGVIHSTFIDCIFRENTASNNGGGVWNNTNSSSTHAHTNGVFFDNFAAQGGASAHTISINGDYTNCSFAKNRSSVTGGHITVNSNIDSVNIQLVNCVIGDVHPASNGPYISTDSGQVNLQHSLSFFAINSFIENGGNNFFNTNPRFINAANGNLDIKTNSKAVNTGSNTFNDLPDDLNGDPRIKHGTIDMGAYEVQEPICSGSLTITGQNCNDPYLVGETISLTMNSATGPGPFTFSVNGTVYSNINSGQIFVNMTEGIDFSGSPPYNQSFTLDSIEDATCKCIPNKEPVAPVSAQFTDSISFSFTKHHGDPTSCLGESLTYTVTMSGGTGNYRYRFFNDKNKNGQLDAPSEIRKQGSTSNNVIGWTDPIEDAENIAGILIRDDDDMAGCNILIKLDTTYIDSIHPTAICQDVTVYLPVEEFVTLDGSEFDSGSFDTCGIASFAAEPSAFSCAQIGTQTVEMTVTNVNGYTASCLAELTLVDTADYCGMACPKLVSTTTEFGPGSLTHQIFCADSEDIIGFSDDLIDSTIMILNNPIMINKDLSLITNQNKNITIDASALSTFLHVPSGVNFELFGLTILSPDQSSGKVIINDGNTEFKHIRVYYRNGQPADGSLFESTGDLLIRGNSNIELE